MNRDDLSAALATKTGTSIILARVSIDVMLDCIGDYLKDGENVCLMGFGTFYPLQQKARKGHNPKTGQPVNIPARIAPKFRAGTALKNKLNE